MWKNYAHQLLYLEAILVLGFYINLSFQKLSFYSIIFWCSLCVRLSRNVFYWDSHLVGRMMMELFMYWLDLSVKLYIFRLAGCALMPKHSPACLQMQVWSGRKQAAAWPQFCCNRQPQQQEGQMELSS